jgi:argininosuccinate lyase
VSLLSAGKALFMGYNRDTQWTKYWIMDLIEETQPTLPVMTDVIRLLRVDKVQMLVQAREEFAGATPLMEWLVSRHSLPLRTAKMIMEKAVKYSEREGKGKISYRSLKKALDEMKTDIEISEQDVEKIQKPERILTEARPIGAPSEKGTRENIASLLKRIKAGRGWLISMRKRIEKAKELVSKMEKEIVTSK